MLRDAGNASQLLVQGTFTPIAPFPKEAPTAIPTQLPRWDIYAQLPLATRRLSAHAVAALPLARRAAKY
jgi:hypothetical protein